MAVVKNTLVGSGVGLSDPNFTYITYYVADAVGDRPTSGLKNGDMAFQKDTDAFFIADSATTWKTIA